MKITCVAGARPNFMKIKPVLDELVIDGHDVDLVHTGQHHDAAMSDVFFDDLGLRMPDVHLGTGSGSVAIQTARVLEAFDPYLLDAKPDRVIVVGDVTSSLACAFAAVQRNIVVAHVEAGLRSHDWAMPEEINRVIIDRISSVLFAPSPDAVANLADEGRDDRSVHLVGNVMIDSLMANLERALDRPVPHATMADGDYLLATLHRPSNVDDPDVLDGILAALDEVASDIAVVLPAHPRLAAHIGAGGPDSRTRRVKVVEPMGYLDFIAAQQRARLIVTDSGGIQEESTALGRPCLTVRDSTERPITVTEGTNRVIGTNSFDIVTAVRETLADPPAARCPALWDGRAGRRIADVITAGSSHAIAKSDTRIPAATLGRLTRSTAATASPLLDGPPASDPPSAVRDRHSRDQR